MINLDKQPQGQSKLFFGEHDLARLDLPFDPKFKALAEIDESNAWFLNVVSCSQDRWTEFPPHALSKFQKTLAYQTVTDSLVPDVFPIFSEIATDPWLKYLYSRITTMEHTHAMSYSSGVTQAFGAKATEFLDIIYTDPKIKERITPELEIATKFINVVHAGWENTDENKKLHLEMLVTVFLLEGVKFPFSFFTSWTLNRGYDNVAQGFSQLLIKIATDEMVVHTATGSNVINKLRKSADYKHLFESGWFDQMAEKRFTDIVAREIDWAIYLLEDGECPGFNEAICVHFIHYWADRRRKEIKIEQQHNVKKNDIEDWFDEYRNINNKTAALQEIDNISYQLGQVKNDIDRFDSFKGFTCTKKK